MKRHPSVPAYLFKKPARTPDTPLELRETLTRQQAAQALGVTPHSLMAWEKQGKLRRVPVAFGQVVHYDKAEILRLRDMFAACGLRRPGPKKAPENAAKQAKQATQNDE